MAIVWGGARGNFRLGIDLIDNGNTFTWIVYGESVAYGHNWSYTLSFSGSTGGSVSGSFYSAWGQTVRRELHRWNSPKQTYSVTATLNSVLVSGASVSRGITVTPTPGAPSLLKVARNSDASHTLNWNRNATYTSVEVQRIEYPHGSWRTIASPSGNVATYTDKSTRADRAYGYRVRGKNAGGTSGWSNIDEVFTTPGAPTSVKVTRQGDSILVQPQGGSIFTARVDIQDDGTAVASNISLNASNGGWVHASPDPMVTHRYRVRYRISSGGSNSTTLYSAWSPYSSVVQLLAPPSAPTSLAPNGAPLNAANFSDLMWVHNPQDSSDQTKYQVRVRAGGAWVETPAVEGFQPRAGIGNVLTAAGIVPAGGDTVEWAVRTWGAHADPSVWSATASLVFVDAPVATIINPSPGTFYEARLTVDWAFFQAQGRSQSGWEVVLLRDGQTVERREGTGSRTSYTFTTGLEDSGSYQVHVALATGNVWSQPETVEINVSFIPPLPGVLEGAWNEQTGAMDIEFFARNDQAYDVIVEPSGALAVEI